MLQIVLKKLAACPADSCSWSPMLAPTAFEFTALPGVGWLVGFCGFWSISWAECRHTLQPHFLPGRGASKPYPICRCHLPCSPAPPRLPCCLLCAQACNLNTCSGGEACKSNTNGLFCVPSNEAGVALVFLVQATSIRMQRALSLDEASSDAPPGSVSPPPPSLGRLLHLIEQQASLACQPGCNDFFTAVCTASLTFCSTLGLSDFYSARVGMLLSSQHPPPSTPLPLTHCPALLALHPLPQSRRARHAIPMWVAAASGMACCTFWSGRRGCSRCSWPGRATRRRAPTSQPRWPASTSRWVLMISIHHHE